MSILNFLKKGKNKEKSVVGRHQQLLFVNKFLGHDFTAMDYQIAKNKDVGEYNEILEEISKLENYMQSEIFTTRLDILQSVNDAKEILAKGYSNCVLLNNLDLEERVAKVYRMGIDYAKNLAQSEGKQDSNFDKLLDYERVKGLFMYVDLNGLLTTSDQQMAWIILRDVVVQTLTIFSPEQVEDYADNFRKFVLNQVVAANKRNDEFKEDVLRRLKEAETEIEKGLEMNKKNYKLNNK